jgi:hypothetical protein
MAKSISAALAAHLAYEVTTLATCWRVTRKGRCAFHVSDHDRDRAFDGSLYLASSGCSRSAIANDAGMAADDLDVEDVLDHEQISEQDLRAGLDCAGLIVMVARDPGLSDYDSTACGRRAQGHAFLSPFRQTVAAGKSGVELAPKQLEVHHHRQPLRRVARGRKPLPPLTLSKNPP